ncbi:hypothetical protein HETIRDRAFT_323190 [Heterobasidion irregulare TC 32-1]|uniref:F-box domain-containing protein n=1 Tax=Heterobasidion irregulare (strain TC 32-1) TaxID=747525 RepID=W4K055_HETIT|nr:uncharacterized protein HETIRDRAFT_323190 [Heterobasidion irregulare TC 32-1]ETW78720.1 hypothetical protein HETIRDRAFT_323190 [Heterobasidion irregulare TC 32-1]
MSTEPSSMRLPAELWLRIFQLATVVPGILEIEALDPFDSPTALLPHSEYEWLSSTAKSALVTKRALVQVCKDFYWLATPLLYEAVFIGPPKSTSVRSLRDAIQKSKQVAETNTSGGRALGSWTRRLVMTRTNYYDPSFDEVGFQCLADIMSCMPNLEILSVHTNALDLYIPSFVVDSLIATSKCSLRKLYFQRDSGLHLRASDCINLLESCRELRAVSLGDFGGCKGLCPIDLLRVSEPSFLSICSTPAGCASKHLEHTPARPSLRHALFSRHGHNTENSVAAMCHFLTIQGQYLESIQLDARFTPYDWTQIALNLFADYCISLTHLTLILGSTSWRSLNPNGLTLPPITHLGLYFDRHQVSNPGDFHQLFRCLSNTHAPSLKVVRILEPRRARHLRRYVSEGRDVGFSFLSSCKFRLEDFDGQSIFPMPTARQSRLPRRAYLTFSKQRGLLSNVFHSPPSDNDLTMLLAGSGV